jgi:hypothetical protein
MEGIDVELSPPSQHAPGETLGLVFQTGRWWHFCVIFPLEDIALGDVFGQRDLWFMEVYGDGGLQEHSPHPRSVR